MACDDKAKMAKDGSWVNGGSGIAEKTIDVFVHARVDNIPQDIDPSQCTVLDGMYGEINIPYIGDGADGGDITIDVFPYTTPTGELLFHVYSSDENYQDVKISAGDSLDIWCSDGRVCKNCQVVVNKAGDVFVWVGWKYN